MIEMTEAKVGKMYPQKTQEEYDTEMIKAKYETMGWDKEPPPIWRCKLDKTGTKLITINDSIGTNKKEASLSESKDE